MDSKNEETERLNEYVKSNKEHLRVGGISDGSHTFDELYHHRTTLFAIISNAYPQRAWKSWKHFDGTMYEDYFIAGVSTPDGDFTYHCHKAYWRQFNVTVVETAPPFDGHTTKHIHRLFSLDPRDRPATAKEKAFSTVLEIMDGRASDVPPSALVSQVDAVIKNYKKERGGSSMSITRGTARKDRRRANAILGHQRMQESYEKKLKEQAKKKTVKKRPAK